jgi:hypothetical protein
MQVVHMTYGVGMNGLDGHEQTEYQHQQQRQLS